MSGTETGAPSGPVDIIVPTAARSEDPIRAISSMLATDSDSIGEIVVVSDSRAQTGLLERISGLDPRVRHVAGWEPFNFSERVNLGVACSSADLVLLANDDTEFTRNGWLADMRSVLLAERHPTVVGAVLGYADLTTQHAGQVFAGYYPGHRGGGQELDPASSEPFSEITECSGVTGALLLVERRTWCEVGGFSASLPVNYNDTDFCLKVRELGGRCVVAPWAGVIHHESRTREAAVGPGEIEQLWSRWWPQLGVEQFHPSEAQALVARMRAESLEEHR